MAQQCRQRGEAGRIPGAADACEHVERLSCHARGEERVEREPECGVAHASASVGEDPGKEVLGGGGEERREEDRGEGAERGRRRRRREAGGGGEARAASGVEEGEPEDGGRLTS